MILFINKVFSCFFNRSYGLLLDHGYEIAILGSGDATCFGLPCSPPTKTMLVALLVPLIFAGATWRRLEVLKLAGQEVQGVLKISQ